MSVDGIWTTELMGLFGWEATGVLLLESGRAIGGGNLHYSVGSYDKNIKIEFKGEIRDGVIEGSAYRADKPNQNITYRLTRRADIPPA